MGDGTASGVQTPPQPGVITRDRENFPIISGHLLKLPPDELLRRIDGVVRALESNRNWIFYDAKLEEKLETNQCVLEFAKIAVERQSTSVERQ